MRRGKRFLENENVIIYVGTAVFVVLAIAVGIVMYMVIKVNSQNNSEQIIAENTNNSDVQDASSNIGKTVEEQENDANLIAKTEETNTQSTSKTESTNNQTQSTSKNKNTNSQTQSTLKNTESTNQNETNITQNTLKSNTQTTTETKNEMNFVKPTDGEIISEFAQENLIYSETLKEWITHTGVDIKADKTSVVKASADGVISSILNDPRYGLTVIITHNNGYETVYSNLLTAEFVVEGEEVEQGQTIGTVGNTASFESSMTSHLHFEILKDGEYINPAIYIN